MIYYIGTVPICTTFAIGIFIYNLVCLHVSDTGRTKCIPLNTIKQDCQNINKKRYTMYVESTLRRGFEVGCLTYNDIVSYVEIKNVIT